MSDPIQPPTGLFGSLRRLVHTGVGAVQNRVDLLGLELQEEKCRVMELLLWTIAAVFLAVLAIVVLTIAVAFLVGETARPYFLLGAGVLYAGGAAGALLFVRHRLKKSPRPFSETVSQLRKDREWLESLNGK